MVELLERVSSRELSEWMAYASIEPFGEFQSEWRMARLASVIAEPNRDEKKKSEPFTEKDFMRSEYLGEDPEEEDDEDKEQKLVKKIMGVFSHFGVKKA